MEKTDYLALLRGINVGGNNLIKMDELKNIFIGMSFTDVKTYIQSGNVLFMDHEKNKFKLVKKIEKTIFDKLNMKINVLTLTFNEIKNILNNIPEGFGKENEKFKYDIVFLIEPLLTKNVMKEMQAKKGEDQIFEGEKVLYIKRLSHFQNSVSFGNGFRKTVQMASFSVKSRVDFPKTEVLENPRLIEKLTGSYLSGIMKTPMWQNITIRNLNTARKLYELMLERNTRIKQA
ncbi:MAG: DUF1697 domain-containing protein [Treponema sp.]|nr:DUF1697 domain-containing protein [Treponema sp.]